MKLHLVFFAIAFLSSSACLSSKKLESEIVAKDFLEAVSALNWEAAFAYLDHRYQLAVTKDLWIKANKEYCTKPATLVEIVSIKENAFSATVTALLIEPLERNDLDIGLPGGKVGYESEVELVKFGGRWRVSSGGIRRCSPYNHFRTLEK